MPTLLLRFLPHIGIVLAILVGVWWIYDNGYDAAEAAADARASRLALVVLTELRDVEARAADRENKRSTQDRAALAAIAANTAAANSCVKLDNTKHIYATTLHVSFLLCCCAFSHL